MITDIIGKNQAIVVNRRNQSFNDWLHMEHEWEKGGYPEVDVPKLLEAYKAYLDTVVAEEQEYAILQFDEVV